MKFADAIVMGGGAAGLVCATKLARGGAKVVLVERAEHLGGRAASHEEKGFTLNQGAHALYRGGAAARTLRELGVEVHGTIPGSPHFYAESSRGLAPLPSTTFGLMRSSLLDFGDKIALARALIGKRSSGLDSISAAEWVARTGGASARAFLSGLIRVSTYAADLDRLSAGAALSQLELARAKGVLYLDGGWQTIVDALERVARAAGVSIVTGAGASRLVREGDQWIAHVHEQESIAAPVAVLALGPRAAHALVRESDALAHEAASAVPIHAACLDVALDALPNPRHHFTLGLERADYLSLHSAFAKIAPEGGAVFHLVRYLKGEEGQGDDAARVRGELEGLFSRAQPEWEKHVVCMRFLPRMIVSNALPLAARAGKRAPIRVPDAPALFACGDWVGDEGMLLDCAIASANAAADAIARRSPQTAAAVA